MAESLQNPHAAPGVDAIGGDRTLLRIFGDPYPAAARPMLRTCCHRRCANYYGDRLPRQPKDILAEPSAFTMRTLDVPSASTEAEYAIRSPSALREIAGPDVSFPSRVLVSRECDGRL